MDFSAVVGFENSKKGLKHSIDSGRLPHAQLFVSEENLSTLPLVFWVLTQLFKGDSKVSKLIHPDIHLLFPISNTIGVSSKDVRSSDQLNEFRSAVLENPYLTYNQWISKNSSAGGSFIIRTDDTKEAVQKLHLKPIEGSYRVLVIWGAEFLKDQSANRLLKFIEEPPAGTLIIMTTQNERNVLETIRSRSQRVFVGPETKGTVKEALINLGLSTEHATLYSERSKGSVSWAMSQYQNREQSQDFEKRFVSWVRSAFLAKKNKDAVAELLDWAEDLVKLERGVQREFLLFAMDQIRSSLLIQYRAGDLVLQQELAEGFKLEKFAPFIHHNNAVDLVQSIEGAISHLGTNANLKMTFSDLALQMTKLLHVPK